MWALKRQITYSLFFLFFLGGGAFLFFRGEFLKNPTCTDSIQNGDESGVDCGGSCSLICSSDRIPIETVWANFFLNDDGTYDIGLLLRNRNSGSSPKILTLQVLLKDSKDQVIFDQKIETAVPLANEFPVILQRIVLKAKPQKVVIVKEEDYSYVLKKKILNPVALEASFDMSGRSSVFVTLRNTTKKDLYRFPVFVVLYNEKREPIGVAESFVDRLLASSVKNIEVVLGKKYAIEPQTVRAYTVFDPYGF